MRYPMLFMLLQNMCAPGDAGLGSTGLFFPRQRQELCKAMVLEQVTFLYHPLSMPEKKRVEFQHFWLQARPKPATMINHQPFPGTNPLKKKTYRMHFYTPSYHPLHAL